jgi:uncharacterized protein YjgD (DUF1641 family)
METNPIEQQLAEINQKLDTLTTYMLEQQRRQREWRELQDDLTIIGKDIFQTAVTELDEVSRHFDTEDLLHLLKKLLRNVKNISRMMDQVESAVDFIEDATPLSKQIFSQLLETLAELEKKGYFEFATESIKIVDTVITTFTVDDIRLLRENIVGIIETFRNMTQPEVLSSVNNALHFFEKLDVSVDENISLWQLLKELNDPEMKRGMAFMIRFMKNMVKTNGSMKNGNIQKTNNSIKKGEFKNVNQDSGRKDS